MAHLENAPSHAMPAGIAARTVLNPEAQHAVVLVAASRTAHSGVR